MSPPQHREILLALALVLPPPVAAAEYHRLCRSAGALNRSARDNENDNACRDACCGQSHDADNQ
jgi:hypothetical protein